MATTSRASSLFGIQDWTRVYQSYRQANFNSYDYETLRKSFIDYITQRYPETFNDYIESSEFVALLDVMAYMGQALAFRGDLNARENFIDTAERRDSVVKLANLVSYTPKRNIAGQGLVKIQAVSTTEAIVDINGINLAGTTVLWNDPANPNWQDQFNSIINATLVNSQRIGTPGNSGVLLGIKTDEYSINLPLNYTPVVPFTTSVDGNNMAFELVSVTSADSNSLYEIPPAPRGTFNIVYQNDKLGYGSSNTGFFFYFKQGSLQAYDFSMPERIENNVQYIDVQGINNTDTWLYQLSSQGAIDRQWVQVETVYINSNLEGQSARPVFSVESRTNDQVTYLFGDGVFGEIPVGLFRAYVRSGNALRYTIDPSEMSGIVVQIPYISRFDKVETLTVTFSLTTASTTAEQRESIAEIKQRAPARYYTQNRMVNGEDYTNFPYTLYSSIIKSKAVNRSSVGVSRNQDLVDPTGKYSSVNVFADDGALYETYRSNVSTFSTLNINLALEYLTLVLPEILSSAATIQNYYSRTQRYSGYYDLPGTLDNHIYWNLSTISGASVTGYFYVLDPAGNRVPVQIGQFSTTTLGYVSPGAMLNFVAPTGFYFDHTNRLLPGTATPYNGGRTNIWVGCTAVVGDGNNFGQGNLSSGLGPVTMNTFVPQGALLNPDTQTPTAIIPSFDNTLSVTIQNEVLALVQLRQNFNLWYDPSIIVPENRWSVTRPNTPTQLNMAGFTYSAADNTYTVQVANLNYFFGSVAQVRFYFDTSNQGLVYDPVTGLTIQDQVNVLRTNAQPSGLFPFGSDYRLGIIGQLIASDGYPDSYSVKVSTINQAGLSSNPDFFKQIVGPGTPLVFFRAADPQDVNSTNELLPQGFVVSAYPNVGTITQFVYEYPVGTIFYATSAKQFYQSKVIVGSNPVSYELINVSTSYNSALGRQGLYFQYLHTGSDTTRIDPGTTNIIDCYLVTQSYYTAYQNYIRDTTGTVPIPARPTIQQLEADYSLVDSYKMMSDTVVLNSVRFKPLFGQKAETALQGTIKVIKNPVTTVNDTQIRSSVLAAMNTYFSLDNWDFGQTFYASELIAYLHTQLAGLISSVVIVSNDPNQPFGDLFQVGCLPDEIFVNGATSSDIIIVSALTPAVLQSNVRV